MLSDDGKQLDAAAIPGSISEKFFQSSQPQRGLQSNWAVDLAKNLEEYLLKICSGEISGDDGSQLSINFAEAALLLQESMQVYSRKVEYLYSLVRAIYAYSLDGCGSFMGQMGGGLTMWFTESKKAF